MKIIAESGGSVSVRALYVQMKFERNSQRSVSQQ
jgi:hypothetical protein